MSCELRKGVVGFQSRRIRERQEEVIAAVTYAVNWVHSEKLLKGNARDLALRRVRSEERQPKTASVEETSGQLGELRCDIQSKVLSPGSPRKQNWAFNSEHWCLKWLGRI